MLSVIISMSPLGIKHRYEERCSLTIYEINPTYFCRQSVTNLISNIVTHAKVLLIINMANCLASLGRFEYQQSRCWLLSQGMTSSC